MLQLADIPIFLTKPLDTSHPPFMTPCTHSDSQTHFGLIKAALKSWLVSILHFSLSPNAHPRWSHRSKFACRCTYPSPHSTNSIQRLQLPHSCLRELLYSVLPLSALLTIRRIQILVLQLLAIPQIHFHQLHHQHQSFHLFSSIIPSLPGSLDFLNCYLDRLPSA